MYSLTSPPPPNTQPHKYNHIQTMQELNIDPLMMPRQEGRVNAMVHVEDYVWVASDKALNIWNIKVSFSPPSSRTNYLSIGFHSQQTIGRS